MKVRLPGFEPAAAWAIIAAWVCGQESGTRVPGGSAVGRSTRPRFSHLNRNFTCVSFSLLIAEERHFAGLFGLRCEKAWPR